MKRQTLLDSIDGQAPRNQIRALVRDVRSLLKSETWEEQIGKGVAHLTLDDEDDVLKEIPKTVSRLGGLWSFTLINRKVKAIPDHLFASQIYELSFQNCPIKKVDGIQQMYELRALELFNNNIQKLPSDIGNLRDLQQFTVSQNSLKSLPASIGQLQSLRRLILSANSLTEVPTSLCELRELTHLDLSHNRLSSLPAELGKLTNLVTIILTNNQLKELPQTADKLCHLTHLLLGYNKLSVVPPQIGKMAELQQVNLTSNLVTDMSVSNRTLTALILDNNALTFIPHCIFLCQRLEKLSLKNNSISELSDLISHLKELRALHLDGNPLTHLPDDICTLHKLKQLTLRETRLVDLPLYFDSLTNLKFIDLDQTGLGFVYRNAIKTGGIDKLLSAVAQVREQINEQNKSNEKRLSMVALHSEADTPQKTKPKPKVSSISGKKSITQQRRPESLSVQEQLSYGSDTFVDPTTIPPPQGLSVGHSGLLEPFMEED